jgi:hypothetical protein
MAVKARRLVLFMFPLFAAIGGLCEAGAGVCPLPGGAAISGRVTVAATGEAIVGALVVAERVVDGFLTPVATTATGPTGHFQFAALPPSDYFVRTQSTALLVDEVWPDVACDQVCDPQGTGTTISVAAGGSVEDIDFTLDAGGRIEGTVRLADGVTPVPDARVESFALGPFGTFGVELVIAGADGAWFVDGLESRSYKVRAFAPGLVAEVFPNTVCSMGCDVFSLGNPIAVTAGATTSGIDVALGPGATVSGTVTDLVAVPLAEVSVSVHVSVGVGSVRAQTDGSGAWSTPEGLLPGTYFARTGSEHMDELWNDLPCEPFCAVTSGTPIVVNTSPVTGIDFALGRLGAISGTIVESGTGLPLANVTVVARSSSAPFPAFATTASDGSYRIGGLAPESYILVAVDGVHVGEIYDDAGTCYDLLNCTPSLPPTFVDVVGAGESAGIDFELDPGGVLSGVVVAAATNAPVAGASVVVFRPDGGAETSASPDASGHFRISAMPAGLSYRVVAQPPGGASLLGEVWEEQPCVPVSCLPDAGTPVPVDLTAPACVAFTLDGVPEDAGISGLVTGVSGPLAGGEIAIYDASGALAGTVWSDSSGAYLTTGALNLAAGSYYVLASGGLSYASELYDDLPCVSCDPTSGTPVVVVESTTTGGIDFDLELVGEPPLPLIYLEDCKPGGCIYFRGFEDSRLNRSMILGDPSASLPEFGLPPEFWDDLVACVQRAYRPFAVEVTDIDPGNLPHLEHVVAGLPQHIGQAKGTLGVSPFTCGFIPNSISFTFAGVHGFVPSPEILDALCWTVVHEIGHQHGVEHHAYVPDAMTYAPGCGPKLLPSRDVSCGELFPQPCECGGSTGNSYAQIRAVHGASDLLFGDGFDIVEPGENCAWSQEVPPPVPFAPLAAPDGAAALRCGALEPSNPGFQPQPTSSRSPH